MSDYLDDILNTEVPEKKSRTSEDLSETAAVGEDSMEAALPGSDTDNSKCQESNSSQDLSFCRQVPASRVQKPHFQLSQAPSRPKETSFVDRTLISNRSEPRYYNAASVASRSSSQPPFPVSGYETMGKEVVPFNSSLDLAHTLTPTSSLPTRADPDVDMGYSSNSACSSCQGPEGSVMDQGSQLDLTAGATSRSQGIDWTDADCESDRFREEDEIEDLLFHFDRYFRNRFDSEIQQFKDNIHSMMAEQQSHVRQIVHTAMNEQHTQNSMEEFIEDTNSQSGQKKDLSQSTEEEHVSPSQDEYTDVESKDKLLLQLTSLSCAIGSMLQRPQYKT